MMLRLEAGQSGGVIVFDLERFTRQPDDGSRLIRAAEARGLVVLDSDAVFDLTTASGKKSFRDAMAAAAYYSDRLSDRTRRGKRAKAMAGLVDARRSFGFADDGVTQIPGEVAILREMAGRLLNGESQRRLMTELEERGVPTLRGARWGYTTLRQLMTRPRNAGVIAHNGEEVARLPGEPVLDADTHARLVALYASRKPGRPPSGKYMLTGILHCGRCGSGMKGRPVSRSQRRQYWCGQCQHTFVDTGPAEAWAGDWVVRTLADPAHSEAVARAEAAFNARHAEISRELRSTEALATTLAERLGRGEIDLPRYDAVTRPLDERLRTLRAALAALSAEVTEPLPHGARTIPERDQQYLDLLERWADGTVAEQRSMVLRALAGRRLVVGPGQPAKFTEGRITVV
jgi:DNA invertase Pin-like site-specific DNA recombinase